ncbi:hypothetical protein AAFN85_23135 [Mucilaginibacter sp. CAU 1740]|uniref:hypothetical protein n=1 Tax=Mucilaginibacter sp. CAU 1740 TaxID=3140365 RepID=UPI00325BE53B
MNRDENNTVDNNQDSTANESNEALESKFNNETVSSDDARLEDEQSHGTVSTDDARLNGDQVDNSLDGDDEFNAEDGDDTFDDLHDESTPQTPVNGSDDDEADLSTSGYDEDRTE